MPQPVKKPVEIVRAPRIDAASMSSIAPVTTTTAPLIANKAAIFELSLSFVVSHYMHIFIGFARNVFQCFRVVLALMIFGQMLKVLVFLLNVPISLYAIFFFEAFYTLLQILVSFIFVCQFHTNVAFRPAADAAKRSARLLRGLRSA